MCAEIKKVEVDSTGKPISIKEQVKNEGIFSPNKESSPTDNGKNIQI